MKLPVENLWKACGEVIFGTKSCEFLDFSLFFPLKKTLIASVVLVTANAVAPGFIATDMVMAMPDNVIDMMKSKVPTGTLGKPEDIANTYCFLASEEASYINGATISVDGGMTV